MGHRVYSTLPYSCQFSLNRIYMSSEQKRELEAGYLYSVVQVCGRSLNNGKARSVQPEGALILLAVWFFLCSRIAFHLMCT
jgi:hypothetical protein